MVVGVVFTELAGFTYTCNLLLSKRWESDEDSSRLHSFELREINVANPFVPQLYVGIASMVLGKHCLFHLVRIENEHPSFSSTVRDKSAFFLDETTSVVEATCMLCSTIWPTETRFFVIVGTCKPFLM